MSDSRHLNAGLLPNSMRHFAEPSSAILLHQQGAQAADGLSDGQLLERFIAHQDPAAFEALVDRHTPRVRSVCWRLLDDPHGTEDAVQDTFLLLMRRARSLSQPERLGNWLYGVASRIARKAKARSLQRQFRERRVSAPPVPKPLADADWRDLCALLTTELNRLPEEFRAPLFLCYWEGKTNIEAARQLGCPTGSMSWRLARGREMLRARLGTCCLP